jgi:hypothetical protein
MFQGIRKSIAFFLLLVSVFLLTGCDSKKGLDIFTDPDQKRVETKEAEPTPTKEPGIFPDDFTFQGDKYQDRYYYKQLAEDEQKMYAYLYEKVDKLSDKIIFGKPVDSIVFHKSYYAILQDCPEFFWLDTNLQVISLEETNEITQVNIMFDKISLEEVKEQRSGVEEVANQWLTEVDQGASSYEKVKKVYEIIIEQTEYLEESPYNQDVRSIFLNHQSVCTGYARSMQYLLNKLEVSCTIVNGVMGEDVPHCWNLVNIDGVDYWTDVTQGDAAWSDGIVCYGYLCFDDTVLNKNYKLEKNIVLSTMPDQETEFFSYPACTSQEHNYFRLEGRQYEVYDPVAIGDSILQGIDEGKSVFAFQFVEDEVFGQAVTGLESQELLDGVLSGLVNRFGVASWNYSYGNDSYINTIYIDFEI